MPQYEHRRQVNEQSRNEADNFRELWSSTEVELLEESWGKATLEDIAAALGRTVEACRQKHYDLRKTAEVVAPISQWSRGFTSLADMGY